MLFPTYLCVAGLVAQMEEASNAVFGTGRRVVLNETEPGACQRRKVSLWRHLPFALSSVHVNDRLARFNVSKPGSIVMNILISDLW
jgi:hypothetical protein